MTITITELEYAVCDVIQIAKQIPALAETRLAVVGGLALWHYLPDHRGTCDINFVVDFWNVELLETMLLEHHHHHHHYSPFAYSDKHGLMYRSPAGRDIQVKFSRQDLFPYLSTSTHVIHEIPYGEVPYVALKGLLLTKLNASWAKTTPPARRKRDAADALALVSLVVPTPPATGGGNLEEDGYLARAGVRAGNRSRSCSACSSISGSGWDGDGNGEMGSPVPSLLSAQQEAFIREALRDVSHTFFSAVLTPSDERPPAFSAYDRERMAMAGWCASS